MYLHVSSSVPVEKEYEAEEITDASNALALMILRIRDGKIRDTVANGVLRNLAKELSMSAKAEGGYPDSDDDEEEEENDNNEANKSDNAEVFIPAQRRKTAIFISKPQRRSSVAKKNEGAFQTDQL